MVTFDVNGNPQPPGIVPLSFDAFKTLFLDSFTTSSTRPPIFRGYEQFIQDFKSLICSRFDHWVDGSYTTQKENPGDIDIVSLVEYSEELNNKANFLATFITKGGSKTIYSVDGYFIPIYPDNDPRYSLTLDAISYWSDWFGKDRNGREKALIELSFI